jgi:hypothetical protein
VGARCGLRAVPAAWIDEVERSTELAELANEVRSTCGFPDWDDLYAQREATR